MLRLFYQEPADDRWFPKDRYPRSLVRRIVRGTRRPGGQERVYLNLKEGLRRLGVPFKENAFGWARRNPNAPVGIIGKPHVLDHHDWENPILFGASIMSHPLADPGLMERRPIKRVLVPGDWMRDMCTPYWGGRVKSWPVGIDVDMWQPGQKHEKQTDILLYNKIRWEHERYDVELMEPIREHLRQNGRSFTELRYGFYKEEDFHSALKNCRAMIFVCEHETQGIAYQQALSCGVPIFAWDRGGFWQDPEFYPDRVKFGPVSAVPYWDERCGEKFETAEEFERGFKDFWDRCERGFFKPRDYVLENLTLEKAAQHYLEHWNEVFPG